MDWWELLASSLIGAVLAFRFFFRLTFVLLLPMFTAMSDIPTPKPGEATVAAAEAPAAVPWSTRRQTLGVRQPMLAPLALDRNFYVPSTWSSGWGK